jgi:hypothetical protein
MRAEWYYTSGGQELGPVSGRELKEIASAGRIQPTDEVWREGMANWQSAASVKGLFPAEPAAAAQPQPPSPANAPPTPSPIPTFQPATTRKKAGRPLVFQILMLSGAGCLIISLFVPWWSVSIKIESDKAPDEDDVKKIIRVLGRNLNWYGQRNIVGFAVAEAADEIDWDRGAPPEEVEVTVRLWGWNTTTGVFAFVAGAVILFIALIPITISELRPWTWGVSLMGAVFGLILLVLGAIWVIGAPQTDVKPFISQANIVGPYIVLVGGLLVFVGGLADGVLGLKTLSKVLSNLEK